MITTYAIPEENQPNYLGDLHVVDALLRGLASTVVARYGDVAEDKLDSAAASEADRLACIELGSILAGQGSNYYPANGWTGEPLAAFIRARTGQGADIPPATVLASVLAEMVLRTYRHIGSGLSEDEVGKLINIEISTVTLLMLGVDH